MKPVLAFRHVPHEGLGLLEDVLRSRGLVYSYVDLFNGGIRHFDPLQISGLIVLGGPMNVDQTDRFPFLADEVQWIRTAIDCGLPVLGICLGSQLIAKSLGAQVYPAPQKEIGWYEIEPCAETPADRLLGCLSTPRVVFQWHGDTFDLPEGAVRLARSPVAENQAFRYRDHVYALQFHIEVTPEMIDQWLIEPENRAEVEQLSYIDPEQIRRRTPECNQPLQELATQSLGVFAEMCHERAYGED